MSVEFYNKNAEEFYKGTVEADMSETYEKFQEYLKKDSHILDLGCGSGRDSRYFIDNGYRVTSADYSEEMVKRASELTKQQVIHLDMTEMDFKDEFDAIWACASVLHIPMKMIPKVLTNCYTALKANGVLYLSFKYGEGEIQRKGRHFSNFTEASFSQLLKDLDLFNVEKFWKTSDVRPGREDEFWLNVVLKK
ncbi:tellurite resistance [Propionigenium maris DSM 9537]|uniref:Tellurite resistance n=1 Tax=Propionigenium maris DSM 9537 TaxID=1123000 RepID=A0A9W6GJV5_9FUSO|nr:class I SAM-dependent methyltransferase [Propionigenium maris]GLI55305.1 tellurite resistance [Propionigenium maris DSM 9537]